MEWKLPETDSDLDRIVAQAGNGPQLLTRGGEPVAVLLTTEDYWRLRGRPADLRHWLLNGPKLDDETLALLLDRQRGDIHDDEL